MEYNNLGQTDIKVSQICLGTMTWGEQNTEEEAHQQLNYAIESGINFNKDLFFKLLYFLHHFNIPILIDVKRFSSFYSVKIYTA